MNRHKYERNPDPLQFLDDNSIPIEVTQSERFNVGYAHTAGRKKNSQGDYVMEDFIMVRGHFRNRWNEDLFGVFDGHDGSKAAYVAASRFDGILQEELTKMEQTTTQLTLDGIDLYPNQTTLEDNQKRTSLAIYNTFHRIKDVLKEELKESYGGTTALISFLTENDLYIANVGDTGAVLGKMNGVSERISTDHRPVASEKARIEASGGKILSISVPRVEGMLAISRALGDFDLEDKGIICNPHIRVISNFLDKGNFIILASDGLWDLVSDADAVQQVISQSNRKEQKRSNDDNNDQMFSFDDDEEKPQNSKQRSKRPTNDLEMELCRELVKMSFNKLAIDNISVLVISFPK